METKSNKFIAVTYELYTVDGEERHLVEKAPADKPFYFISGFGVAIDEFEKAVIDLAKGDSFDFTLTKEQAYGEYEEERVLTLDKSMFEVDGHFDKEHIFAGAVIPLQNEEGQRFMGTVVEIQDAALVIDLNHPLAGHELNFKGSVIESREATSEEIQSLIMHLSGHGCEGGCSGCGGGCDNKEEGCCNCN